MLKESKIIVCLLMILLVACNNQQIHQIPESQSNIVLIMADDLEYPEKTKDLLTKLENWQNEVDAVMPLAN
jgi:type III secretory pathway lipoprotein EscJ